MNITPDIEQPDENTIITSDSVNRVTDSESMNSDSLFVMDGQSQTNGISSITTLSNTAQNPSFVSKNHKVNKEWLIVGAGILVLALIMVATISFWPQKKISAPSSNLTPAKSKSSTVQAKTVTTNSATTPVKTTSQATATPSTIAPGIPNYLYQSSQTSQGAAVGYLKIKQTSYQPHGLLGSAIASADSPNYQTAIFYPKSDGIYAYGKYTNSNSKVANGTTPVFSSILQKLATSLDCTISMHDFTDNSDTVVATPSIAGTQTGAECYRPVEWSPDGKSLLFTSNKPVSNSDIGLVTFSIPYIYDVASSKSTAITIPDGLNSLQGNGHWQDAQSIVFSYVLWGYHASIMTSETVTYSLVSKQYTKLATPDGINVSSIQTASKALYILSTSRTILYSGSGLESNSLKPVSGLSTDAIGSYLLEINDEGTVSHLITAQGQFGIQGGVKFYDLNTASNTQKLFFTPDSYSSNLIGWGQSYDQLIYNKFISSKSSNQIRLHTLSSGQDDLLVDDVIL